MLWFTILNKAYEIFTNWGTYYPITRINSTRKIAG